MAVTLLASLSSLVLVGSFLAERDRLWEEWMRWRCAREAREGRFTLEGAFAQLAGRGRDAFPLLARFVSDRDPDLRSRTIEAIDGWPDPARGAFLEHLRSHDAAALFSYLLPEPPDDEKDHWRKGGQLSFEYWSGDAALPPPRTPGAVAVCERALRRGPARRAANALGAMLRPPRGGLGPALAPDSLLARIRKDLEDLSRTGGVDLGLLAAENLAWAAGLLDSDRVRAFYWWEQLVPDPGPDDLQVLLDPSCLRVLACVDNVRTLRVLLRLWRLPAVRDVLAEALAAPGPRFPLPLPRWLPLPDAAGRFLRGTRDERWTAAWALGESPLEGGAEPLIRALSSEEEPDLRLLYRASLLSLGDSGQERRLLEALDDRLRRPFEPGHSVIGPTMLSKLLLSSGRKEFVEEVARRLGENGGGLEALPFSSARSRRPAGRRPRAARA